ncbi:unnamed protein product [Allacma fusca]|uniref:Uncharacterized protein n=1 Tax=Allacma fusca TaxID=39272 RepID=A0A8J2LM80_9HEXA|nr:unnamed protein product [Allacma fusca]
MSFINDFISDCDVKPFDYGWCSLGGHSTMLREGVCLACSNPASTANVAAVVEEQAAVKQETGSAEEQLDPKNDPKLKLNVEVVLKKLRIITE